jgi:hypothetical protein
MIDPESEFLQTELKDLHGQLQSLDKSIHQIETRPATEADLNAVTSALQRLDPIWEVLYPEEQRRVLELLVDGIDVGKTVVTVQFRADGIEQIASASWNRNGDGSYFFSCLHNLDKPYFNRRKVNRLSNGIASSTLRNPWQNPTNKLSVNA